MRLRSIELLDFRNHSNNIVKLINKGNSNLHHLSTCTTATDQWNSQRNSTKTSLGINSYTHQSIHNQTNNSDLDTFTPFQPHLTTSTRASRRRKFPKNKWPIVRRQPVPPVSFPWQAAFFFQRETKQNLHTPHFILHSSHSKLKLHTPYFRLHTSHFSLPTASFTLHTSHFTQYSSRSTFHTALNLRATRKR